MNHISPAAIGLAVVPAFFIGLVFIIMFIVTRKAKRSRLIKGTVLFKLDIKNRTIKRYIRNENKIDTKQLFNFGKMGKWIDVDFLIKQFVNTKGEKFLRNLLATSRKKRTHQFESFTTTKFIKNKEIQVEIIASPIEESNLYTLTIAWNEVEESIENLNKVAFINETQIQNVKGAYKAFFGFMLNTEEEQLSKEFFYFINSKFSFTNKGIVYRKSNIGIIIISSNNIKTLKKKIHRFRYKTMKKLKKGGINKYIVGSSLVTAKNVTTKKVVNQVLAATNFRLYLSRKNGVECLDDTFINYKPVEADEFKENLAMIKEAIASETPISHKIPIKKTTNGRKIIDYFLPGVKGIKNEDLDKFLINRMLKQELIDAHAKRIATTNKNIGPLMLDVSSQFLIKNEKKIKYKKAIYVVNVDYKLTEELLRVVTRMKKQGFVFGMRIVRTGYRFANILSSIEPDFLIIDSRLSSEIQTSSYINLLLIKKITEETKTKLIYENPSISQKDQRAKNIGMDFFFNTKDIKNK